MALEHILETVWRARSYVDVAMPLAQKGEDVKEFIAPCAGACRTAEKWLRAWLGQEGVALKEEQEGEDEG